jgi:dTMP kinase
MVQWAAGGLEPDLSVLIDVDPAEARRRLAAVEGASPDRLERLDPAFHHRVRAGFTALAADDPGHWAVVSGAPAPDEVAREVLAAVTVRLGRPSDAGDS